MVEEQAVVMRVIVCGSRRWHDRRAIESRLYELAIAANGEEITIVHGAAQGADRIAEQEAQKAGTVGRGAPGGLGSLGKRAGLVRNAVMANHRG